jgi:hypothetical protein
MFLWEKSKKKNKKVWEAIDTWDIKYFLHKINFNLKSENITQKHQLVVKNEKFNGWHIYINLKTQHNPVFS